GGGRKVNGQQANQKDDPGSRYPGRGRHAYMRRLTRMMLTNLGAKSVLEASDGLAALEAIRTADPDVMLLDWDMPVLNGIEVLRIAAQSAGHHADHARACKCRPA